MDFIYFRSPRSKEDCSALEAELKSKGFRFLSANGLNPNTLYRSNLINSSILQSCTNRGLSNACNLVPTYVEYRYTKNNEIINIF